MQFNSIDFLIFFPVVTLIYFLIPHKFRWAWLLGASYYFYMCWNAKYAVLMLLSTAITYLSGLLISKSQKIKFRKMWVAVSFISNMGILAMFKYYSSFIVPSINRIFDFAGISVDVPAFDVLLPVGISFYTFQALSYTMDVYRKEIEPIKHFGKYALFVSFFPQLVAGPIERSKNLIPQFEKVQTFDYTRANEGLLRMMWGFFQKMVIADRLAIVVDEVYNGFVDYSGIVLILATVFFAFQVLCDFSAYTDIAIGAAKVMGFDLMENFNRPFFSKSVADLWRRWHISMGSWFRDYLYIPLGGSRKGKVRKCINLMITFLASGLWHGASWTMVIFGGLNGLYQVISIMLKPVRDFVCKILRINRKSLPHRLFQIILVFTLFCITLVFVRSESVSQSIYILKNSLAANLWVLRNGTLFTLGLEKTEFFFSLALIVFFMLVQLYQRNHVIIKELGKAPIVIRWSVYVAGVMSILLFGAYGLGYDAVQFIYFQF